MATANETMTRIKSPALALAKQAAEANRRPLVHQLSIIIEEWCAENLSLAASSPPASSETPVGGAG